jgi:hypothetical protein
MTHLADQRKALKLAAVPFHQQILTWAVSKLAFSKGNLLK